MSIDYTKPQLRKQLLAKRKALQASDALARSQHLSELIIGQISWSKCTNLHCFLPLADDNEPDLRAVTEYALDQGVEVYTSDPSAKTGRKTIPLSNENSQQRIIHYDLSSPVSFDYIIVPMLGFSGKHRVGFGGGFYDKFLASQPEAKKIGVCFKEFELEHLPVESHDQPLDKILIA